MNVRTSSALRSLDAAVATLSAGDQERARAALERIVTTAPSTGAAQPAGPTPGRRSRRRLVLLPMAALTLAVASIVTPGLRGDDPAYASWTATPASVTGVVLDAAAAACRDKLQGSSIDLDRARLVLAERRGDYVALLFRTENPDMSGACLARNPHGSTNLEDVDAGVGGSSGLAEKAPATGFTQGAISQFGGASITDGAAGDAVTGVAIHAGTHTVNASVQNGRYAAWWPGRAFQSGPPEPSGEGGPEPILTYDLTLRDGTVIHNARPTRPS